MNALEKKCPRVKLGQGDAGKITFLSQDIVLDTFLQVISKQVNVELSSEANAIINNSRKHRLPMEA